MKVEEGAEEKLRRKLRKNFHPERIERTLRLKGKLSFTLTEAVLVFSLGPRCSKLGSGNLMFSVKSDIRS